MPQCCLEQTAARWRPPGTRPRAAAPGISPMQISKGIRNTALPTVQCHLVVDTVQVHSLMPHLHKKILSRMEPQEQFLAASALFPWETIPAGASQETSGPLRIVETSTELLAECVERGGQGLGGTQSLLSHSGSLGRLTLRPVFLGRAPLGCALPCRRRINPDRPLIGEHFLAPASWARHWPANCGRNLGNSLAKCAAAEATTFMKMQQKLLRGCGGGCYRLITC